MKTDITHGHECAFAKQVYMKTVSVRVTHISVEQLQHAVTARTGSKSDVWKVHQCIMAYLSFKNRFDSLKAHSL